MRACACHACRRRERSRRYGRERSACAPVHSRAEFEAMAAPRPWARRAVRSPIAAGAAPASAPSGRGGARRGRSGAHRNGAQTAPASTANCLVRGRFWRTVRGRFWRTVRQAGPSAAGRPQWLAARLSRQEPAPARRPCPARHPASRSFAAPRSAPPVSSPECNKSRVGPTRHVNVRKAVNGPDSTAVVPPSAAECEEVRTSRDRQAHAARSGGRRAPRTPAPSPPPHPKSPAQERGGRAPRI